VLKEKSKMFVLCCTFSYLQFRWHSSPSEKNRHTNY